MKNIIKILMASLLIFVASLSVSNVFGDTPPPPPPEGGHGSGGNQVPGGGAPIGSGIVLLISLAAGYGAKKVFTGMNVDKEKI